MHPTVFIGLLFFLILIVYATIGSIETAYIATNGLVTKGRVYKIVKIGSKGVKNYHYKFRYKNRTYYGKSTRIKKPIGEEVIVLFLEVNPEKNIEKESLTGYRYFFNKNPNLN